MFLDVQVNDLLACVQTHIRQNDNFVYNVYNVNGYMFVYTYYVYR